MELTGVYVPIVTPFDESGRIDTGPLEAVISALLSSGVEGIVACGTTGEAYALSLEERRVVTSRIKELVAGAVPILGGVGGMSTDQALDHALLAKALELDGLMVAAPAYCLPTESELTVHVQTVVKATGMPTVLYDYPQRTGVTFTVDVLDSLAHDPLVVGIKEASGDLGRISVLAERYAGAIEVVCGADAAAPAFLDAGARCWIGGIANLLPAAHVAMLDPAQRDDVHAAILPLAEFIESGRYIAKIKAGMGMRGLAMGAPRAPLARLDNEGARRLSDLLDQAGRWAPALTPSY
jgi:4-hydroxy-tetrahydrodipicolinate synthase